MENNKAEYMKEKFDRCQKVFSQIYLLLNNKSVFDILEKKNINDLDMLEISLDNFEIQLNNILYIIENIPDNIPDNISNDNLSNISNNDINNLINKLINDIKSNNINSKINNDSIINIANKFEKYLNHTNNTKDHTNITINNTHSDITNNNDCNNDCNNNKIFLSYLMYFFMLQDKESILNKEEPKIKTPFDIDGLD